MRQPSWVELAKRLRWDAEGLVEVAAWRTSVRHPWGEVRELQLARGRWGVLDLDVGNPWFDTVPLHVEAETASGERVRRRLDRDRLVRFGRLVVAVDPGATSRPVTRGFLQELAPVLGWAGLPGRGPVTRRAADDEPPDPFLL